MFSATSSAAASSSGSTSSAASPSNKGALLLEVRRLGNPSHPLTMAVSQLKRARLAETWAERFIPPAQLVGAVNLRELKTQMLTRDSPLFLPLYQLMQEARANLMPQLANKDLLQQIFQIYESFIAEVCAVRGKERSRLLKGDVLLEGHAVGQVLIPQEVGLALASYSKYGEMLKSNELGSSAVQKVGGIYYKRERYNPLAPGNELLFNSLSSFFSDRGSPPTLLLKLRNIYAKVPLIRPLPDLRSSYPFEIERRSVVIQASKAVEGRNLYDFILKDEQCSINPTSFTLQVMLALLFRLSDARADNYIVSDDGFLSLIDADPLFDRPVTRNDGCHLIRLRSILLLLPDMNDSISEPAKTLILGVLNDIDQLLIDWMVAIQKRNGDYIEQQKAGFLHSGEMRNLSLPIAFSYSHFITLYRQLHTIRSLLSDAEIITHWDLFSSLYPNLSRAYQELAKTEKPLPAQERLFSGTLLSLEEILGGEVEEPLVQENLTPLLPIPKLLQKWLDEPSDRTAKEERRLIEQVLPLTEQETLFLKRSALDDRDLHYLVSRFKLQQLLFDQTPNITSRGLVDLLSEHPSLQITVGTMAHFEIDHWFKLFDLHFDLGRTGHLFIEGETVPLTADRLLFSKLLYAQRWMELEALIKLGFNCTSEQLGQDLLHHLAKQSFPEAISFLINHGYPADLRNNRGQTPLHLAAQAGRIVNFAPLLSRDPESINNRDMEGRTPLLLAVIQGHQDAVEKLLELNANPFLSSKEKENALHYATFYGHSALLNVLLQTDLKGAIDAGDSDGKAPLHRAVWLDPKPEIVHLLLNAGATVDQRNLFGYTPLHWAAKHGHLASARMLLERAADFTLENQNGHTPLDIAVRFGQDSIVRLFLNPEATDVSDNTSAAATTNDPEGSLYIQFEEAYYTNRPFDQIVALEKLANTALQNENFVRTSHLLNSALAFAQKWNINPHYQCYLFHRLESLEGRFLEKTFGVKTPASHRNYLVSYRSRLKALREEVCYRLELDQEPVETTLEFLTQGFNAILCDLIEESLRLIGKAPPIAFAIITLGSLARHEPSLYSDVEFAILIAEDSPAIKTYFRDLAAFLKLKIGNFGETKFEIVDSKLIERVIQEPKSLTPRGFSIDIDGFSPFGKTAVDELIATPIQMASFQDPSWLQQLDGEPILANALSCVSHLYGDEALVTAYREEVNRYLDVKTDTILRFFGGTKEREKRAISILEGHLFEFRPYLEIDRLEMRAFDTKRDLYRPIQTTVHALMLYHGINTQSTLQGIEALRAKGIISTEGAHHLASALTQILQLRLKAHAYYQTDKELLYFKRRTEDTEGMELFHINQPMLILALYRVLTPLHNEMMEFVQNPKRTLQTNQFYDGALGALNIQTEEELNHTTAASSYVQAATLNPEDEMVIDQLGNIKRQLGETREAVKHYQKELRILKEKHGDKPHLDIATTLCNLGNVHWNLSETTLAIDYFEQSLAMDKFIYGGKPHPDVATSLNNLGSAYWSLNEMARAIDYFEHSLAMKKLIYGDKPHPSIAMSLGNLGSAYEKLTDYTKAHEAYQKAYTIYQVLKGDDHKETKKTLAGLQQVEAALAAQSL